MAKKVYINAATAIAPNGVMGDDNMLHAVEPDYKEIIANANLRRRMSHIVKMGVACGLQCIQKNGNKPIDAIITATGLGCLADTEKFLNAIIDSNEQLLNPTAFTQSTFNIIGSQIALLTNNKSYNNTYVHRGLSFESALIDGMMRIKEGDENVLVGAMDEVNQTAQTIMTRLGLLDNVTMGEGAQFFVLANEPNSAINPELKAIKTYSGKFTSDEMIQHIKEFLKGANIGLSDIDILLTGDNGNTDHDKIYTDIAKSLFSSAKWYSFKDVCGEYPTASSNAFYMATKQLMLSIKAEQNVLIYNHYNAKNHSLILLGR